VVCPTRLDTSLVVSPSTPGLALSKTERSGHARQTHEQNGSSLDDGARPILQS